MPRRPKDLKRIDTTKTVQVDEEVYRLIKHSAADHDVPIRVRVHQLLCEALERPDLIGIAEGVSSTI